MLLTEIQKHSFTGIEDLIDFIQLECSPYFSQTGRSTFRGIERMNKDVVISYQRADRTPSHTSQKTHEIVDNKMSAEFGHNFRSDALFCSGCKEFSRGFGCNVAIMIPIGKFEFLWSKKVPDMYDEIAAIDHRIGSVSDEEFKRDVTGFVKWAEYQTTDLDDALKSTNEIMMSCKRGFITLTDHNVKYFSNGKMTVTQVWDELI